MTTKKSQLAKSSKKRSKTSAKKKKKERKSLSGLPLAFLGLDLSIRGTGLVVLRKQQVLEHLHLRTELVHDGQTSELKSNGVYRGTNEERIDYITSKIGKVVKKHHPVFTAIEGHSFGSQGRGKTILAELHGVIKNRLHRANFLFMVVPPPTLKVYAVGDGRGSKEDMLAGARKVWKDCDNDDEADAFHLATYARQKYAELVEES